MSDYQPTDVFTLLKARNGKPVRNLWRFVQVTGFCWLWTGFTNPDGYGMYSNDHGSDQAHRQAYEALVAPIQKGFELDHLCRVRNCVNPDHLEPVTRTENIRRTAPFRANQGIRTAQCQRGHAWTPENTLLSSDGGRRCRTCRREAMKAWKSRQQNGGALVSDYLYGDVLVRKVSSGLKYVRVGQVNIGGDSSRRYVQRCDGAGFLLGSKGEFLRLSTLKNCYRLHYRQETDR